MKVSVLSFTDLFSDFALGSYSAVVWSKTELCVCAEDNVRLSLHPSVHVPDLGLCLKLTALFVVSSRRVNNKRCEASQR